MIRLLGMPLLLPPKDRDGESVANLNQAMLAEMKQTSRLERKDKVAISCAHLLTGSGDSAAELLLFFERGSEPVTLQRQK